jgi:hypothetical protein
MSLHRTYGVYPNGDWKRNAVAPEHLPAHIQYNDDFRPGRALVVDGAVVLPGFVSEETLQSFLKRLPELDMGWNPASPTIPYQ